MKKMDNFKSHKNAENLVTLTLSLKPNQPWSLTCAWMENNVVSIQISIRTDWK